MQTRASAVTAEHGQRQQDFPKRTTQIRRDAYPDKRPQTARTTLLQGAIGDTVPHEFIDNRAQGRQLRSVQRMVDAALATSPRQRDAGVAQAGTGHPVRTQAHVASHANTPVQLVLKDQPAATFRRSWGETKEVGLAAHAYNQDLRSKSVKERIEELGKLQALLIAWFDANKGGDLDENADARSMKVLLNDVQREHIDVVHLSVRKAEADPPVAGFDTLPVGMQTKVRKIWDDLKAGTGNVVITEDQTYKTGNNGQKTVTHAGFADQALAAFARLLESEFGRSLMIRANSDTGGRKTITIRPGNSLGQGEIPSEEFLAAAHNAGKGELTAVDPKALFGNKKKGSHQWRRIDKYLKGFPELVLPGNATPEDRIRLIHDAPAAFSGAPGYRIKDGAEYRYYKFNEGSASTIVFAQDIQDATDHMTSRFVDSGGNEIIVPVFVTLAHELGHALHFLEGNTVGAVGNTLGAMVAPGTDVSGSWSNFEEYQTIKVVENTVRKQAGATERFSHHNFLSYAANEIRRGPLEQAYDAASKLQGPVRTSIEQLLGDADSALGIRDLKLAKTLLKKAQGKIESAQAALQQLAIQQANGPQQASPNGWLNFWPFR